jgi:predicted dehydrogenase
MTPTSPVRVGLIGAGRFSQRHIEAYRQNADCHLVAICRRDAKALVELQDIWGIPQSFTDYQEILASDDIDAVDIVTPTNTHHRIALDAIAAGKHVICEKPLGMDASESRAMLDAAKGAGVVHCVNFNQRSRTALGQLKRFLDQGYVGRIYHLNILWEMSLSPDVRPDSPLWRFSAEAGGGVVRELCHVFDAALFLGGEVRRICSMLSTAEKHRFSPDAPVGLNLEVPDSAAYLIEFSSGATAVISTSFVTRGLDSKAGNHMRIDVAGETGRIMTAGLHEVIGVNQKVQAVPAPLDPGPTYASPIDQFIRAITTGAPVETDFTSGLDVAVLIDAAYDSAFRESWVYPKFGGTRPA